MMQACDPSKPPIIIVPHGVGQVLQHALHYHPLGRALVPNL